MIKHCAIDQPGFDAVTFVGWGDVCSALKNADGADDEVDETDGPTACSVGTQQNRSPAKSFDVRNLVLTDESTSGHESSAAKNSKTCLEGSSRFHLNPKTLDWFKDSITTTSNRLCCKMTLTKVLLINLRVNGYVLNTPAVFGTDKDCTCLILR